MVADDGKACCRRVLLYKEYGNFLFKIPSYTKEMFLSRTHIQRGFCNILGTKQFSLMFHI